MGRQSFYEEAEGMSEHEAFRNACNEADEEYGHQEGYSGQINCATDYTTKCLRKPKPAKTCKVSHSNVGVTKKWETIFTISPRHSWDNNNAPCTDAKTKTEAIKKAKEYAIRYNMTYTIAVAKRLTNCSSEVAQVSPNKSVTGLYAFKGEARC